MKLYYSDDWREELIELSDERLIWYMNIKNELEYRQFYRMVNSLLVEFRGLYGVDLILTGRSGRHVCVRNDADTRRQLMNMQRTVYRMQNKILQRFDAGWRINKFGTLYHVNGSIRIGSVNGREIITRHP